MQFPVQGRDWGPDESIANQNKIKTEPQITLLSFAGMSLSSSKEKKQQQITEIGYLNPAIDIETQ